MSGGFRFVLSLGLCLLSSSQAFAVSNQMLDGNALNVNAITPATVNCDSLCGIVVDNIKGDLIGLNGSPGWAQADDQWCADHQVGTNPTVFASPVPAPADAPKPPQCNVPLLYGDTSCQAVNQKLTHCKLHGSQIETQCLAYATTKEATGSEKVVMGFDVAATATCTTACVSQWVPFGGQAMVLACNIAGYAASGAEIIQNLTSKSSGMQKIVGSLGAGFGAIETSKAIVQGGLNGAKTATTTITGTLDGTKETLTVGKSGLTDVYSKAGNNDTTLSVTHDNKAAKKQACIAAVTFGALTGLRAYNMSQHGKTKDEACQNVQQLVSQSFAPGFAVPTTFDNSGDSGNSGNSTLASSGSTGASSGTGAASGGTASSSTVRTNSTVLSDGSCKQGDSNCFVNTLARVPTTGGDQMAATDAGLLKSSGLAKALANQAAALPLDSMVKHLDAGGSAGDLIGAALNGQGGAFGQGIAALANQAQKDAASMGGAAGPSLASAAMAGGGGGMAGGQDKGAGAEENPFKLMGQGDQLAGNQDMNFNKPPGFKGGEIGQDGDIYHSRYSGSIFEIVSHKIQKTTDRVENVGYVLPMNRALAGHR